MRLEMRMPDVHRHDETLDGANNAAERAIGWCIKGWYRAMHGYQRARSAIDVLRPRAWVGNHLGRSRADLTPLVI